MTETRAAFLVIALVVSACSDGVTRPSVTKRDMLPALDLSELNDPDGSCAGCHVSAAQAASGGRASGHSEIFRGVGATHSEEQVSFIALAEPSPTSPYGAKGQLQGKGVAFVSGVLVAETRTHAEIDCLRIVGNVAWLSGPVRRYTINGEDQNVVGLQLFYKVQDNGEGNGSPPDAAPPLLNNGSAGPLCTFSDFPLFQSVEGNSQVRAQ